MRRIPEQWLTEVRLVRRILSAGLNRSGEIICTLVGGAEEELSDNNTSDLVAVGVYILV